jgi:hypothetical protein
MGQAEVIKQEVGRCIQSLDRKSVEERVNFFNEKFGIDFLGNLGKVLLEYLIEKRNKLLHEEPSMGVSATDTALSFALCMSLGLWLLHQIDAIASDIVVDKKDYVAERKEKILQTLPRLREYKERRDEKRNI